MNQFHAPRNTIRKIDLSMKLLRRLRAASPHRTFLIHVVLSILLGSFWYWMLYGHFHLYFTHVNWIYLAGGDVLQHQLGWEWFRQEPWQFPLGKITSYGYPFGTSLTFMDSIPLLAIPFKLFSTWFKQNCQYFGLWELSSVIGQMLAGMLVLHRFIRSYPLKILGASLLVLSPPMIFRAFYHSSLSAHWILLFAIWFILLEHRQTLWRGAWWVLLAVAVLIHVYYVPMLIPLWLIGMFFRYKNEPKRLALAGKLLVELAAVVMVVSMVGYATGLFSLSYQDLALDGFGVFSWNLNGFFNPFEYSSSFVKAMDTGLPHQFEGFSYLGLGNLLILPIAGYLFLENRELRHRWSFFLPFAGAVLVYTLFALSNRAFLNMQPLWHIQLPGSLAMFFNLFRVSGRFIWPVYYLLVLFGIIVIIRHIRYPVPVLFLVLLLQFVDIQPLYQSKKLTRVMSYPSTLQAEVWKLAAITNKHIVVIPIDKLRREYEPIALYAARNQLTLNLGYFARSDTQAFKEYRQNVWDDLNAHRPDTRTMYIITNPEWIEHTRANLADGMLICELDGHTVLFSVENELAKAQSDLSPYCSIPSP